MDRVLSEALVNRQLIQTGTEVSVNYPIRGFANERVMRSGSFPIQDVLRHPNGNVSFRLIANGETFIATSEQVTHVDGMEPAVFARAYQLDEDGQPLSLGRKRGRKSKHELVALMLQEMLDRNEISNETVFVADISDAEEDDEEDIQIVHLNSILFDDIPPMLEMDYQGEAVWILPMQVKQVDGAALPEMLAAFQQKRREARLEKAEQTEEPEQLEQTGYLDIDIRNAA